MKRFIIIISACALLASCAHALSEEFRKLSEDEITFLKVQRAPEGHIGQQFIWGGFIANGKIEDRGTFFEIVQTPVDGYGKILDTDKSEGRFIAFFPDEFHDPAIYERGRLMTLGGTLTGTIEGKLAGKEYTYPLLEVAESRLWKKELLYETEHRYWYSSPFPWPRTGPYPPY
jgi:outer membrane lipoprotein